MPSHITKPVDTKSVSIIGGSIAGLFSGLSLLQLGWDVHIFESATDTLASRGAGVTLHPSLFTALNRLGIAASDNIGIQLQMRKTFDRNGSVVGTFALEQTVTSWGCLYQLLKNEFPSERYHQGLVFSHYEQNDNVVTAFFEDGSCHNSTFLIAADGIRSTVRKLLEPNAKPEYAGYVAWRGLIDECDLDNLEMSELFPYFTFCLPEGEQVLCYPVAGEQHQVAAGLRRYNVVWYRPADRHTTLKSLLTDINGNNNGESIAPDKVRPEIVKDMLADAARLLSPQHAKLMGKLEQPFIQPIYDLTTDAMVHDRVVLIGDAAFTARPHLGMGISKAAHDSLTLADSLRNTHSLPDALAHFERKRQPANLDLVNQSRALGAYLQAQISSEGEQANARLHRSPEAVMRETANMLL